MQIRQIQESDNEALAAIIRKVFEEHKAPTTGTVYADSATDALYSLFRKEGSLMWVAEMQGEILGCCGIYPTEGLPLGCAELVKLYLDPKARGLGLGKQLFQKSIQWAKTYGYQQLYLESLPQFDAAIFMYEKEGFKSIDHPLGKSGHTSCNIWMLMDLK